MVWHGFRLKAIAVSFALGLACLFGGQWLYDHYGYQQSLQQVLDRDPRIAGFRTEEEGDHLLITVQLQSPADLKNTYRTMERKVQNALGNRSFVLQLADKRSPALEKAFYKSHFAIYEALVRGSFRDMEAEINAQAGSVGAEAEVYIDNENVYIALTQGDHFLTTVIPRRPSLLCTGPQEVQ